MEKQSPAIDSIKDLSTERLTMLFALTVCYGHALDGSFFKQGAKLLHLTTSTISTSLRYLSSKGFANETRSGGYFSPYTYHYSLAKGLLFRILMVAKEDAYYKLFDEVFKAVQKLTNSYSIINLTSEAIAIINRTDTELSGSISSGLSEELIAVFPDKDFREFFRRRNDSILFHCVYIGICNMLVRDDAVDWEYLRQIVIDDRRDREREVKVTDSLHSLFNLYYYLGTGKMSEDLGKLQVDEFSLSTAAIQYLYQSKCEAALKLFLKAITCHNKTSNYKGFFEDFFVNYYYLLCLLLTDTEQSKKKLETLIKKKDFYSYNSAGYIFTPLYDYFISHKQDKINSKSLSSYFAQSHESSIKWLCWMVQNRLGTWPDSVKKPSLTKNPPHAAWLKAELMPTGVVPKTDAGANNLGASIFFTINIRPVWAMRLQAIIDENTPANGDTDGKVVERDTRLIYLLEYEMIVPIQQKRKKNGDWSVGRRLSPQALKRLSDADVPLDDVDRRFISSINEWDYSIYQKEYLPDLVDSDHVYVGSSDSDLSLLPVSIHKDKPFLIIDKDKDGTFSISTNVETINSGDNYSVILKKNTPTDYSVYSPSSFERNVYSQLLAQKKYPKEAEPLLMKLIAALGGKTEIHSNMVVDLDDLEKVNGVTKLTLRCVPDSYDSYSFSVSVHVFSGLIFVPGEGNITTIAEKDGHKVQVVRNLREERKHLKALAMKLSDLEVVDDESDFRPTSVTSTVVLGIGQFLELIQWVKDNTDICEMEWPEGAKVKYHPTVKASAASIGFKAKNGWFDVEGDVRISEDEVVSLQRLLELMHDAGKQKYIKIGENEYITLSGDLSKILKRLDTVTTDRRNHLQMASAAVGLLGDVLDNTEANISHSKVMDDLRKRIAESANVQPEVPATLQATLRDYQEEGYDWLERVTSWGAGACLADDMGLGKTLQTITMLLDKESEGPSLVVAPASVVPNWRNELQRFAPTLSVTILNAAEDRDEAIKGAQAGDVVVSTYALINICQEQLAAKEWNIICLDEAHTIKNPNTKMSKAAMTLQAKRKVILTGTPIQNHLSELWNLFQFINPGLLGSADQFGKKFIVPIEVDHDKERQNQLRRLISPFLLRRTKGEVIEELPEKNEITLPVELSSDEMTTYEVHRRQAEDLVLADKSVKVSTLAEITKLRELACSVSLVDKKWKRPSSKVLAFIDLAESLNDSGNRALVFSQFTSFFNEVKKAMDKAKLPYLYLDGSTPMAQREKLVRDFQKGKCPFFLISLKAGGLGLNLTGANYVIHLDPWWNPAIEQQATDRAYRIGQKQDVTVYHLISQHTIEEKIQRLHKSKRDLADSLLEGTDMSHALTQEELLELLS